ncbi:MAG TPA: Rieske (2Fe-2S) protein [Streptosporangiaceae bacterium]|jgi:nitrite reductase/ring-hydroxylating ferredoxin subunit
MQLISRLEQARFLDPVVTAGQRVARLIRPGKARDALHGVWLGHPVHPVLVQAAAGAWLSASLMDLADDDQAARRLTAAGLAAAVPAALAGAADWSEQHEQQMRVGVVHAAGNAVAISLYGASLAARGPRLSRALRLGGLAAVSASGLLGGHISFRLAGGANHAEDVPHVLAPGWHYLMVAADLPEGKPVRQVVGEVPVVAVRDGGSVRVLADRCSHMSGSLAEGELADGCLTCPWHGSIFRVADGSVARGPATAPQPSFEVREVGGAIQVCLPGAG